jgi:hypothetical protein
MPGLIFFGKSAVGFEQQFNGVAEILPSLFECFALGNGAGNFLDVGNVTAPLLFRNLFVYGCEFDFHTRTQTNKFRHLKYHLPSFLNTAVFSAG